MSTSGGVGGRAPQGALLPDFQPGGGTEAPSVLIFHTLEPQESAFLRTWQRKCLMVRYADMNESLEQFRGASEELANSLIADAAEGAGQQSQREHSESSSETWGVSDISHDLRRMVEQARDYDRAGVMFPSVLVEDEEEQTKEIVLVDVPALVARFGAGMWAAARYRRPWPDEWPYHSHRMVGGFLPNAHIQGVPPQVVEQVVRRPLLRFLANRLLGRSTMVATSTAPFTLHCRRKGSTCYGMTAFYTPAYFITLGPYGSALTSPVGGSLAPGYYHFGADHVGGGAATIDYNKRFDIPVSDKGWIDV